MVSERTPLRRAEGGGPPYVFMTNPNKLYRKQIHQFQCFVCTFFLFLFSTAVVISILHSVEEDTIDNPPSPSISDNSSIQPLLNLTWPIADKAVPLWQSNLPSENDMMIALIKGQQSLQAKDDLEKTMRPLAKDTASYKHQRSIKTSPRALYLARTGYIMDVATKTIVSKMNKTDEKNKKFVLGRTLKLNEVPPLPDFCSMEENTACEQAKYRSVDGSCNNLKHSSTWGVAMQPFRRILPPDYADGVSSPRMSSGGTELPSAREVSVVIHRPEYRDDPKFTVMLAVWGQFLDHDISATALSQGKNGETISCCDVPKEQQHPECFPVRVGSGDPYFNVSCLEFVRSAPAPTCSLGPREQLNQASSFIDGSVVYGNTPELSQSLRSFEGGQLRMTVTPDGRELLPISTDPNDGCNREEENVKGRYCFASGDQRANENMHLTTMHLILARQHNNLASQLAVLNPTWNDEKIYQESRKIVSAQMQHITYNEFLPVLIGPQLIERLVLNPETKGYSESYDDEVDPSVSNSFAAASFRFAHTLLPGVMKLFKNSTSEEKVELHNMLFNPYKLYSPGYFDSAMLGAINTPLERMDNYFNKEVTENLFKQPNKTCGLDLVSLNVQRGRDHGLPGYPEWREHCGLGRPSSFDDLKGLVDDESLKRISELYKTVDDVDLYTGALSEYPLEGGMLGATLTCLIGDQFMRLKLGDRYWYETSQQPQAFSPEQLSEIRKTSLAQLICDNADNVTFIQPRVMESIREGNTKMACENLMQPNLVHWSESRKPDSLKENLAPKKERKAVAVKVISGFISTDDGNTLWDGTLPLVIPTKYFSHKKMASVNSESDPAYIDFANLYKIQWEGHLSKTDEKYTFSGSFSFPYLDFSVPFSANSIKWLNGKFLFLFDTFWNNTDSFVLSGSYSSPIIFSEKSLNPTNILQFVIVQPKKNYFPMKEENFNKVPIILNGSYLLDRSGFSWNGHALIKLPLENNDSIGNNLKISNKNSTGFKVGFKITSGSVRLGDEDGFQETLWSGTLPVDITNPLFQLNDVPLLQAKSDVDSNLFQYAITWTAVKNGSKFQGKFTLPLYNYTNGYKVVWMNGEFDVDALSTSNMTLDDLIDPSKKYTSRVIFREKLVSSSPLKISDSELHDPQVDFEQFIAESNVIEGAIPAPIILEGTFSPDKKIFHWSGDGQINLKTKSKTPTVENPILKSTEPLSPSIWSKYRFGCFVQAGSIKENSGLEMSLTPPIEIPIGSIWTHNETKNGFSYSAGITWSGRLGGTFSTTLKGSFYFPQSGIDPVEGPFSRWKNGTFSLDLEPLWNIQLGSVFIPGANYFSKIALQEGNYLYDGNSVLDLFKYKASENIAPSINAPIILQGRYSPLRDKFFWNGNMIISFQSSFYQPLNDISDKKMLKIADTKPAKTTSRIKVSTGSLSSGPATQDMPPVVWEGDFPVKINVDSLVPPNSFVRGSEVVFSGKIGATNMNGIFSVPVYDKNGNSTLYTGSFSFDYSVLWSQTVDAILKSEKSYVAKVFFNDEKKKSANSGDSKMESNANLPINMADNNQKLEGDSSGIIISLLGYYYSKPFFCPGFICNTDKLFYWSGDALISVGNQKFVLQKSSMLNLPRSQPDYGDKIGLMAKKDKVAGKATKEPKPTKPPKPPTPTKLSVSLTVVSGQISAGFEGSNATEVWNGAPPVTMTLDNVLEEESYTTSAQVTWTGSVNKTIFEGTFSVPTTFKNETDTVTKDWQGSFSVKYLIKWSGKLEPFVKDKRKLTCRVLFKEFAQKSINPANDIDSNQNYKMQKAAKVDVDIDSLGPPSSCNIILVGRFYKKPFFCKILPFFCTDSTIFTWNGEAIVSYSFAPPKTTTTPTPELVTVTEPPSNELKLSNTFSLATDYPNQRVVIGKVLSGYMKAGLSGESKRTLWSGSVPTGIPFPVFWAPVDSLPDAPPEAFSHGVIWSGSAFGSTVECSFQLPQYISNGAGSSLRWWNGELRVHIQSLWMTGIGGLIIPGVKYYSMVAFRETKKYSGTNVQLSATQDEINSAYKAPLILLGSYSADRKMFYWSGDFILVFKELPVPYMYDLPELSFPKNTPVTESKSMQQIKTLSKASKSVGTNRKSIIAHVSSGRLVAGLNSFSKKTVWSGEIPTGIPLPVFWMPTSGSQVADTDVHSHGVIWSGAVFGNTVQCSFFLPQYTLVGKTAAVRWWKGDISLKIESAWDTGLAPMIAPGFQYYSRVSFGDMKNSKKILTYSPTQDEINSSFKAPITLLGTYSADKKTFYWTGAFVITFDYTPGNYMNDVMMPVGLKSTKKLSAQKSSLTDAIDRKTLALIVESGSITRIRGGNVEENLWSGEIPTTIPVMNSSSSILLNWSGNIENSIISGKYSSTEFMKGQQAPLDLQGSFSLNISPMWNSTLDVFITAGKNFTSKLILRELSTPHLGVTSLSATAGSEVPLGSIILLGQYSLDRSAFTWFGQAIFNIN